MRRVYTFIILALAAVARPVAAAEAPVVPSQQATVPQATPRPGTPAPVESDGYTYQPEGRRDTFMSLLGTGSQPRDAGRRGDGLGDLLVGDVSVRGILQTQQALVAMVLAPNKKTYVVHNGDRFLDGLVKSVTSQGLVIMQDVNDPLSLVKQREIRKLLRSLEDAKE
jgi:Tfp pilus assembly protein PilP